MPDAVPSPLREQIAAEIATWTHAVLPLDSPDRIFTASANSFRDDCKACQAALGAADAVLPLVEAAVVAERENLPPLPDRYLAQVGRMIGEGIERGIQEAVAAERLRLHTQLRDQITALRRPEPARIGGEAWSQLAARSLRWEGENDMLARVLALLGVAATPPGEQA